MKKEKNTKISPVVLGIGVGVGLYLLYTIMRGNSEPIVVARPGFMPRPFKSGDTPPDLNGPRVKKGVTASTKTTTIVEQKDPRFKYAQITKTQLDGYRVFTPPVNGIFTRRLLASGGKLYAEILPV